MAYKPSTPLAPDDAAATAGVSPVEGVEAALRPDPVRQAELENRGGHLVEHAGAIAHTQALRAMNAVRTLSPILAAAVAGGGDDREQSARFSALLSQSNALASESLKALGYDPTIERNRWMLNVFERGFAEVVAAGQPVGASLPSLLASELAPRAAELPGHEDLSEENTIALALTQGLWPVICAQQDFDFGRDKDKDVLAAREILLTEVTATIEALAAPMTGASERRTLFLMLCQEGGRAFADAWSHEAVKAREVLSRKTRAEVTAWRAANPQGFPIESVFTRFRQAMHRIRIFAKPAAGK